MRSSKSLSEDSHNNLDWRYENLVSETQAWTFTFEVYSNSYDIYRGNHCLYNQDVEFVGLSFQDDFNWTKHIFL